MKEDEKKLETIKIQPIKKNEKKNYKIIRRFADIFFLIERKKHVIFVDLKR